jgi:hypothetical protein
VPGLLKPAIAKEAAAKSSSFLDTTRQPAMLRTVNTATIVSSQQNNPTDMKITPLNVFLALRWSRWRSHRLLSDRVA